MRKILSITLVVLMLLSFLPAYAEGPDNSDVAGGVSDNNKESFSGQRGELEDPNVEWDKNRGGRHRNNEYYKDDYENRLDFAKWQDGQGVQSTDEDYLFFYYVMLEEKEKLKIREIIKSKVSAADKLKLDRWQDDEMSESGKKIFDDTILEESKNLMKKNGYIVTEVWSLKSIPARAISKPIYNSTTKGIAGHELLFNYIHTNAIRNLKDGRTLYRVRTITKIGSNRYRQMDENGNFKFLDPVLMRRYNAAWAGMDYEEFAGSFRAWQDFKYCRRTGMPKPGELGDRDMGKDDCYQVAQGQDMLQTGHVQFDVVILNPKSVRGIPDEEKGKAYWVSGFNFLAFSDVQGMSKEEQATNLINLLFKPKDKYEKENVKLIDASSHFSKSRMGTEPYYLDLRDTKTKDSVGAWDNADDGEKNLYSLEKENEMGENKFNIYPGSEVYIMNLSELGYNTYLMDNAMNASTKNRNVFLKYSINEGANSGTIDLFNPDSTNNDYSKYVEHASQGQVGSIESAFKDSYIMKNGFSTALDIHAYLNNGKRVKTGSENPLSIIDDNWERTELDFEGNIEKVANFNAELHEGQGINNFTKAIRNHGIPFYKTVIPENADKNSMLEINVTGFDGGVFHNVYDLINEGFDKAFSKTYNLRADRDTDLTQRNTKTKEYYIGGEKTRGHLNDGVLWNFDISTNRINETTFYKEYLSGKKGFAETERFDPMTHTIMDTYRFVVMGDEVPTDRPLIACPKEAYEACKRAGYTKSECLKNGCRVLYPEPPTENNEACISNCAKRYNGNPEKINECISRECRPGADKDRDKELCKKNCSKKCQKEANIYGSYENCMDKCIAENCDNNPNPNDPGMNPPGKKKPKVPTIEVNEPKGSDIEITITPPEENPNPKGEDPGMNPPGKKKPKPGDKVNPPTGDDKDKPITPGEGDNNPNPSDPGMNPPVKKRPKPKFVNPDGGSDDTVTVTPKDDGSYDVKIPSNTPEDKEYKFILVDPDNNPVGKEEYKFKVKVKSKETDFGLTSGEITGINENQTYKVGERISVEFILKHYKGTLEVGKGEEGNPPLSVGIEIKKTDGSTQSGGRTVKVNGTLKKGEEKKLDPINIVGPENGFTVCAKIQGEYSKKYNSDKANDEVCRQFYAADRDINNYSVGDLIVDPNYVVGNENKTVTYFFTVSNESNMDTGQDNITYDVFFNNRKIRTETKPLSKNSSKTFKGTIPNVRFQEGNNEVKIVVNPRRNPQETKHGEDPYADNTITANIINYRDNRRCSDSASPARTTKQTFRADVPYKSTYSYIVKLYEKKSRCTKVTENGRLISKNCSYPSERLVENIPRQKTQTTKKQYTFIEEMKSKAYFRSKWSQDTNNNSDNRIIAASERNESNKLGRMEVTNKNPNVPTTGIIPSIKNGNGFELFYDSIYEVKTNNGANIKTAHTKNEALAQILAAPQYDKSYNTWTYRDKTERDNFEYSKKEEVVNGRCGRWNRRTGECMYYETPCMRGYDWFNRRTGRWECDRYEEPITRVTEKWTEVSYEPRVNRGDTKVTNIKLVKELSQMVNTDTNIMVKLPALTDGGREVCIPLEEYVRENGADNGVAFTRTTDYRLPEVGRVSRPNERTRRAYVRRSFRNMPNQIAGRISFTPGKVRGFIGAGNPVSKNMLENPNLFTNLKVLAQDDIKTHILR